MITEEYFHELVKDLFLEYLPKVKAADRKEFSVALLDELKSQGFDFEEETPEDGDADGVYYQNGRGHYADED